MALAASIHPLGRDVGLERSLLPTVFSLFFGSSIIGKLCFGLLADRFDLHRVMAIAILILAVALIALSQITATSMTLLYSYAIFAGLGFGAFTCIQVLIAAHYSGRSTAAFWPHRLDRYTLVHWARKRLLVCESGEARDMALLGMAMLAAVSAVVILRLARRSHSSVTMIS